MISIGVNIVGNLILIPTIGTIGPPLATALASTINVYMLYRTLGTRGHFVADAQLRRRLPRLVLAAALMGIALYFGQALVEPFAHGSLLETLPALGVFVRSEEHTSELQSLMRISYAVFCLKKK